MKLSSNSKLLFIGDSITDSGRNPSGEVCSWEPNLGLGNGYVSMIHSWINAAHPESAIRFLNRGTSGNTVRDLADRWQVDMLAEMPQTLCIMIGINDVWRQFDCPLRPNLAVGPKEYRAALTSLVAAAKTCVTDIHLATPYFIEPNRNDAMRQRMDEYGSIVREVAVEAEASLIDTQTAFDRVLAHHHPMTLAADRVHPNGIGHMIIARAFLASFGCI